VPHPRRFDEVFQGVRGKQAMSGVRGKNRGADFRPRFVPRSIDKSADNALVEINHVHAVLKVLTHFDWAFATATGKAFTMRGDNGSAFSVFSTRCTNLKIF